METTTEANPNNRELTTTEIKIAIAQIDDRLMRVACAQNDLSDYSYSLSESDIDQSVLKSKQLRIKYNLPENLWLCNADGSPLKKASLKEIKKHIAAFVKGTLDENTFSDLLFYFEEISECDYGWILIERPLGYYQNNASREYMDSVIAEMESIGTRSRFKNKNLPKICGMFSAH